MRNEPKGYVSNAMRYTLYVTNAKGVYVVVVSGYQGKRTRKQNEKLDEHN